MPEQSCGGCRWFRRSSAKSDFGWCKHPMTKLRPVPAAMLNTDCRADWGGKCKTFERKEVGNVPAAV